jgi:hypothetical protein
MMPDPFIEVAHVALNVRGIDINLLVHEMHFYIAVFLFPGYQRGDVLLADHSSDRAVHDINTRNQNGEKKQQGKQEPVPHLPNLPESFNPVHIIPTPVLPANMATSNMAAANMAAWINYSHVN